MFTQLQSSFLFAWPIVHICIFQTRTTFRKQLRPTIWHALFSEIHSLRLRFDLPSFLQPVQTKADLLQPTVVHKAKQRLKIHFTESYCKIVVFICVIFWQDFTHQEKTRSNKREKSLISAHMIITAQWCKTAKTGIFPKIKLLSKCLNSKQNKPWTAHLHTGFWPSCVQESFVD